MDDQKINIQGGAGNQIDIQSGNTTNQQAEKIVNITSAQNVYLGAETINKPFNLYLCRKLTEALSEYKPDVKDFLDNIDDGDKANWETDPTYSTPAFSYIISGFGVLGILLRKVISSGSDAVKLNNTKDYLEVCVTTAKRTLQLLSYAFISKLWDHKKDNALEFTPDQSKVLTNFFNPKFELKISKYAELLKTLVNIFDEHKIEYPFSEFKKDCLNDDSSFTKASKSLEDINKNKPDSGQSKSAVAELAEKELTEFLCTLTFLAGYKMVSVKEISYETIRNKGAQYLHSYTFLGGDGKDYSSKYKYDSEPISSDAVLLFKNKYQEGLNLFPFIIDINALTGQTQARICFYTLSNEDEKKLTYADFNNVSSDKADGANDSKNASQVVIVFNEEVEYSLKANTENDITKIKEDSKKYNDLQLNTVYKIFQTAKTEIFTK
jgi:hypothetical protein